MIPRKRAICETCKSKEKSILELPCYFCSTGNEALYSRYDPMPDPAEAEGGKSEEGKG
jgi:hypothetical protein